VNLESSELEHFRRRGFFFIANPCDEKSMLAIDHLQREIEPKCGGRTFPTGFNRNACQFLMMGELVLQRVEDPDILDLARCLLDCDEIEVGACGLGDAAKEVSAGSDRHQVHWHTDGGPEDQQVSLRMALDRHGPDNGPLRILPASHLRAREEVAEELRQLELASGTHDVEPDSCFARHPEEVEVHLDPRWTLVWTPSAWHATGLKTAAGPRRAMAWNYFPRGGRRRDVEALKYLYEDQWENWTEERKRLWALID